jgi:hypothetical protein
MNQVSGDADNPAQKEQRRHFHERVCDPRTRKDWLFSAYLIYTGLASLFLPALRLWTSPVARREAYLTPEAVLSIIGYSALIGFIGFVLYFTFVVTGRRLADRNHHLVRVYMMLVLGAFPIYMITPQVIHMLTNWRPAQVAWLYELSSEWQGLHWLVLVWVVLALQIKKGKKNLQSLISATLLYSFIYPVLCFQILFSPGPRPIDVPVPAPAVRAEHPPVIFLVFDSLDKQTFANDGNPSITLPNFERLISQSIAFPDGEAPGFMTTDSLPRMVFQDPEIEWDGVRGHRDQKDTFFDLLKDSDSICQISVAHVTASRWMPTQIHISTDLPFRIGTSDNLDYWDSIAFWSIFSSDQFDSLTLSSARDLSAEWHQYVNGRIHSKALASCLDPTGRIAMFHYLVPHAPFIYGESGEIIDPGSGSFELNMRQVDRFLGELLDALQQSGQLESATLVVTGDHDEARDDHPPLWIKLPGQTAPKVSLTPLNTANLAEWLKEQPEFLAAHGHLAR